MKKAVKWVGAIVVVLAVAVAEEYGQIIGKLFHRDITAPKRAAETEAALRQAVEDLNKGLPRIVDADTRLDSATSGPGLRLTYFYTWVAVNPGEMTEAKLQEALGGGIREGACNAKQGKNFLDEGVTFVYHYKSRGGAPIGEITVSQKDC